jgi:hypothetical protein
VSETEPRTLGQLEEAEEARQELEGDAERHWTELEKPPCAQSKRPRELFSSPATGQLLELSPPTSTLCSPPLNLAAAAFELVYVAGRPASVRRWRARRQHQSAC